MPHHFFGIKYGAKSAKLAGMANVIAFVALDVGRATIFADMEIVWHSSKSVTRVLCINLEINEDIIVGIRASGPKSNLFKTTGSKFH